MVCPLVAGDEQTQSASCWSQQQQQCEGCKVVAKWAPPSPTCSPSRRCRSLGITSPRTHTSQCVCVLCVRVLCVCVYTPVLVGCVYVQSPPPHPHPGRQSRPCERDGGEGGGAGGGEPGGGSLREGGSWGEGEGGDQAELSLHFLSSPVFIPYDDVALTARHNSHFHPKRRTGEIWTCRSAVRCFNRREIFTARQTHLFAYTNKPYGDTGTHTNTHTHTQASVD